jgi:hypothetical protein
MPKPNSTEVTPGRFNMTPSALVVKHITTTDTALAAQAATRRFEYRERELRARIEAELQAVRDAYLNELAALDLE